MKPRFNSEEFLILNLRLEVYDAFLVQQEMSSSQLIVLLKLSCTPDETIQSLARQGGVTETAITLTLNYLAKRGLISKSISPDDGRSKQLSVTTKGHTFLSSAEQELKKALTQRFNPHGDSRAQVILENGLLIAANMSDLWPQSAITEFPVLASLASIAFLRRSIDRTLKATANLTRSEGRTLLQLLEAQKPLRGTDIACMLQLPNATITRACAKLSKRHLLEKVSDPSDRRAALYELSEEGYRTAREVEAALAPLSEEQYWGELSPEDHQLAEAVRAICRRTLKEDGAPQSQDSISA